MEAMRPVAPITAMLFGLVLNGCQTDTMTTASGSPEVTVRGTRPETVKPKIINAAQDLGMTLKHETPIEVTLERPWQVNAGPNVVASLASLDGSSQLERFTFSVADSGGGTRIVLDRYMVRVSRQGKEYVSLANDAPGAEKLQGILDSVAPSLESSQTIDLPAVSSHNPPPRISAPLTKLTTENIIQR
jgi:hypothetical protein